MFSVVSQSQNYLWSGWDKWLLTFYQAETIQVMVSVGLEKNPNFPTSLAGSHLLSGIFTREGPRFEGIFGIKGRQKMKR